MRVAPSRTAHVADIGGTNLRAALVSESGETLQRREEPVGVARDMETVLSRLARMFAELGGDPCGIGIGFPGISDTDQGMLYASPHFPLWRDVPLREILPRVFSGPVIFDNDANFAAVGELCFGAGRDWRHFIMLTLGTGIGGGVVMDRKLWRGASGFAGEVGHMTIDRNGPLCACGKRGCWEVYAGSQLATPVSAGAWEDFGRHVAIGIANLEAALNLEHYILGGGLIRKREWFEKTLTTSLPKNVKLRFSDLKGDSALLGAAATVFHDSADR